MGSVPSRKTHPEGVRNGSSKSKAIDKGLSKDHEDDANKFKILLLGGSECGKTTIFKQMRILHMNGFSKEDSLSYRPNIHFNAADSMHQILVAIDDKFRKHEICIQEDILRFKEWRGEINPDDDDFFIPFNIGHCIERIWNSPIVKQAYLNRFTFPLLDSAKYFLDSIDRLTQDLYVPTTQDIIHCRLPTMGIKDISFEYKKISFKMVDVGGQRSERRKWIHCFDNVDMVLFMISMPDYDLADPEDSRYNRMMQNFEIFKAVVQSEYFKNASVVLFMNKYDVFEEKLLRSPLKKCWKTYEGNNSVEDCTNFITRQFRRCVSARHRFSAFCTNATDTSNIELVFSSAVAHIVNENLKSTGLHE